MGDNFVYKDAEGTSTEWDDIQRKLGNLPEKPPPKPTPGWVPEPDRENAPKNAAWLQTKSIEELEDLEDDSLVEDDRFLEQYRKQRLAEMREIASKQRFGSVQLISGSDYVREVSQAPADVWVVVHLFKDGLAECELLGQCLNQLAAKYTNTKFVKIVSTDCIKNYPDNLLPTLLVYNSTNVKANLVGLRRFGGPKCTPEDVALVLSQVGPVLGNSGETDSDAVRQRVQRDYIEKMVLRHATKGGNNSDEES